MSERQALLRGVIRRPDDDLPRLVFADWLDEHGESERAEFIRLGCRLAEPGGPRAARARDKKRAAELLAAHGPAWAAGTLGVFAPMYAPPVWDRGFLTAIAITHAERSAAGRLFAEHPIRALCYVVRNDVVGEVATFRPMGRVRSLVVVTSGLSAAGAAAFAGGRRFGGLQALTFVTTTRVPPEARAPVEQRFDRVAWSTSRRLTRAR